MGCTSTSTARRSTFRPIEARAAREKGRSFNLLTKYSYYTGNMLRSVHVLDAGHPVCKRHARQRAEPQLALHLSEQLADHQAAGRHQVRPSAVAQNNRHQPSVVGRRLRRRDRRRGRRHALLSTLASHTPQLGPVEDRAGGIVFAYRRSPPCVPLCYRHTHTHNSGTELKRRCEPR